MSYPSVIAIDGPVASGKTTVGREVARRLGYQFVDTGVFYRAVTLAALRREVSVHDPEALTALAESLELRLAHGGEGMLVDGEDVTGELRAPDVDASVSSVAETAGVRRAVLRPQREAAGDGNVVMVGRDIGTIVLPGSAKVYLDASVEERARRRALELQAQGARRSEADVRANLEHRDAIDSQRSEAPLRAAADAHVAATDGLDVQGVVELVLAALAEQG